MKTLWETLYSGYISSISGMVEPSPRGEIWEMDIGTYLKCLLLKGWMGFSPWSRTLRPLHLVVMNSLRSHSCAICLSRSLISVLYWLRSFSAFSFNKTILDWASALNYNQLIFAVNALDLESYHSPCLKSYLSLKAAMERFTDPKIFLRSS